MGLFDKFRDTLARPVEFAIDIHVRATASYTRLMAHKETIGDLAADLKKCGSFLLA